MAVRPPELGQASPVKLPFLFGGEWDCESGDIPWESHQAPWPAPYTPPARDSSPLTFSKNVYTQYQWNFSLTGKSNGLLIP